jgi:hypothetical protein
MKRWIDRVLRIALGAVFLLYAYAKFAGHQFSRLELDDPINQIHPITLFWYFFGYSKGYAMFIACGELLAGLLVMFRRTSLIGLPLYCGIALNVTVLDWNFGLPVPATLLATSLFVVSLALIITERRAYLPLFRPRGA